MSEFLTDRQVIERSLKIIIVLTNECNTLDLTHSEKRGVLKVIESIATHAKTRLDMDGYDKKSDIDDIPY